MSSVPTADGLPRAAEVRPTADVQLVVEGVGPASASASLARLLLVADIVTRLFGVVHSGRRTTGAVELDVADPTDLAVLRHAWSIPEASVLTSVSTWTEAPGRVRARLNVAAGSGAPVPAPMATDRRLVVGLVESARTVRDLLTSHANEPLGVRLALLRFAPSEPAALTQARLNRADETLQRWQFKMAGWAEMPPAASPPEPMAAAYEHLTTALDTHAVLTALHRVESDLRMSSGAKFALFSSLDRVLGLDLCRLVGTVVR